MCRFGGRVRALSHVRRVRPMRVPVAPVDPAGPAVTRGVFALVFARIPRGQILPATGWKVRRFGGWKTARVESVMEVSTTLVLAGLIGALLWFFTGNRSRKPRLPPGPTPLPLVGNLHQIDKKTPFKSFVEFSKTHGPVLTVRLGWQRVVVLVGYDAVKGALVDQADDFTGRGPLPFLVRATRGYGLGISNGDRWRQLRRFTLTTLRDFGMGRKGMEEWIQEESQHLRDRMSSSKGEAFDPTLLLTRTVSNVICCLVFGQRFNYDDQQFLLLLSNIGEAVRFNSSAQGMLYNLFPRLMERLPGYHHTAFGLIEDVREFVKTKIQEHKDTLDLNAPRDYIDCYLIRSEQEKDLATSEFHYENLVATVMNLFLAGTETTSSTIRYALSVLMKHRNIQEKMQQEIDAVIGRDRAPRLEDRKSLPFSDAVIHEVQRFLDIVPLSLPHYALEDISFRGYTIPKGTQVIPLLHSVLKEETQWATPWSFNPQHFLDHNGNFKKNPSFMPFSAGKRACVGESLARMELFIFLVSLLQSFTFSCPEGPEGIDLLPEYSSFANVPRRYDIIATPR
ncbi:cytochrome P450 2Y3 [Menidia menidia]